jgi:hypothetical protein
MRSTARHVTLTFFAVLVTIALASIGCQGSSTVTGPSGGVVGPAASIAGTWSGTYQSDDLTGCGGSSATATFQQNGTTVTGLVSTSSCGVTGYFKGRVQGNLVTGAVAMEGCVGGGTSGTISGSELVLSIGDMTKPLVTGDKVIMYGGVVTFHR